MVLERGFVEGPGASYQDFDPPMHVQLNNPETILDYLTKLQETLEFENIKLDGVMFGVNDYFSLRDLANTRSSWGMEFREECLTINGIRILIDPMRDAGAPVAVFNESEAIKVMSMRRKT